MGSILPAPSDGETYKAVEVQWSMPQPNKPGPCPAVSSAASPAKSEQASCLPITQNLLTTGSVDLRGAKYGNLYAWVPKGAQAPLVILGRRQLEAQFPANDSTARVCTPQIDCNVIWVPISVDLKFDDTDGALAGLSLTASGPSETYPDVDFALFENITLAYPASPASPPLGGTTGTGSGDATPSLFSASSSPLVPLSTAIPARGSTSQIGATSTGGHHASASVIVPAVLCALFGVAAVTFGVLWWLGRRRGRAQMAPSAAFRANPETAWVPIDEKRQHLAGDGAGPSSTV